MNNLAPAPGGGMTDDAAGVADAERFLLPRHAHIVVYERDVAGDDDRQLVTIYDCGAAQKPPSAQLLGELGSVRADCETTRNPTGYVVSMREPAVLVDEGGHYVVRPR